MLIIRVYCADLKDIAKDFHPRNVKTAGLAKNQNPIINGDRCPSLRSLRGPSRPGPHEGQAACAATWVEACRRIGHLSDKVGGQPPVQGRVGPVVESAGGVRAVHRQEDQQILGEVALAAARARGKTKSAKLPQRVLSP